MSAFGPGDLRLLERDPLNFDTGGSVEFLLLESGGVGVVAQRNVNPESRATLAKVRSAFRLFAAAPELLAALHVLVDAAAERQRLGGGQNSAGGFLGVELEALAVAEAAIAKASTP